MDGHKIDISVLAVIPSQPEDLGLEDIVAIASHMLASEIVELQERSPMKRCWMLLRIVWRFVSGTSSGIRLLSSSVIVAWISSEEIA